MSDHDYWDCIHFRKFQSVTVAKARIVTTDRGRAQSHLRSESESVQLSRVH